MAISERKPFWFCYSKKNPIHLAGFCIIGTVGYFNKVPVCSILRVRKSLPGIVLYQNNKDKEKLENIRKIFL